MPTRRFRKNNRKSRRGGILGIPFMKYIEDNIKNCEKYWSEGKDPKRCILKARGTGYGNYINYPGLVKQKMGRVPKWYYRNSDGQLEKRALRSNEW
jgi:hypothetical protein